MAGGGGVIEAVGYHCGCMPLMYLLKHREKPVFLPFPAMRLTSCFRQYSSASGKSDLVMQKLAREAEHDLETLFWRNQ